MVTLSECCEHALPSGLAKLEQLHVEPNSEWLISLPCSSTHFRRWKACQGLETRLGLQNILSLQIVSNSGNDLSTLGSTDHTPLLRPHLSAYTTPFCSNHTSTQATPLLKPHFYSNHTSLLRPHLSTQTTSLYSDYTSLLRPYLSTHTTPLLRLGLSLLHFKIYLLFFKNFQNNLPIIPIFLVLFWRVICNLLDLVFMYTQGGRKTNLVWWSWPNICRLTMRVEWQIKLSMI